MTNKEQEKEIQNAIYEGFLNIKEFNLKHPGDIAFAIQNSLVDAGYEISKTR